MLVFVQRLTNEQVSRMRSGRISATLVPRQNNLGFTVCSALIPFASGKDVTCRPPQALPRLCWFGPDVDAKTHGSHVPQAPRVEKRPAERPFAVCLRRWPKQHTIQHWRCPWTRAGNSGACTSPAKGQSQALGQMLAAAKQTQEWCVLSPAKLKSCVKTGGGRANPGNKWKNAFLVPRKKQHNKQTNRARFG